MLFTKEKAVEVAEQLGKFIRSGEFDKFVTDLVFAFCDVEKSVKMKTLEALKAEDGELFKYTTKSLDADTLNQLNNALFGKSFCVAAIYMDGTKVTHVTFFQQYDEIYQFDWCCNDPDSLGETEVIKNQFNLLVNLKGHEASGAKLIFMDDKLLSVFKSIQ